MLCEEKAKKKYMCVYGHPTYPNFCDPMNFYTEFG